LLGKPLRRRLSEHNWLDAIRTDSNRYQTWARLRKSANLALDDLSLLAERLPNEKQEEIFTYQRVHALTKNIIWQPTWETNHDERDFRRTYLAAEIAEECITKCIKQYKKIEPDEVLAMPLLDKLQESIAACKHIAQKYSK
jgi:hypothetical protein